MNALTEILAAYSDGIAKFASTVTCLHFLSGAVLMNDIRRFKSSDAYQIDPFLGGIVQTLLSLKLGAILNDTAMIQVNAIGLLINILYANIFYYYSSANCKKNIWSKIAIATAFCIICFTYIYYEDTTKIAFRLGMIITVLLIILVGMPLLNLGEIIRKKSTEGLPFPIIMGGSIVSASWMLYGISIENTVLIYQNMLLLLLSCIQLSLFAIYSSKNKNQQSLHRESNSSFRRYESRQSLREKLD